MGSDTRIDGSVGGMGAAVSDDPWDAACLNDSVACGIVFAAICGADVGSLGT